MAVRRKHKFNRAEAIKTADNFRTRIFKDKTEAYNFYQYALKENLAGLQIWIIPDIPEKYRVIWFEGE